MTVAGAAAGATPLNEHSIGRNV